MKHIFLINPAAGKGRAEKIFLPEIITAVKKEKIEYEIHRTIGVGDTENFVRKKCMTGGPVRFYACGGDGTLNEVVNGAYGFENAEIAVIPAGTGNDFVRNFENSHDFSDIHMQIHGKTKEVDIIQYSDQYEKRYALNMFNIGMDCAVVAKTAEIKKYPLMIGGLAYGVSAAIILANIKSEPLELDFGNGDCLKGEFVLAAVANGSYCGGGFKSTPKAVLDDGLMDVIIVKKITRRGFLSLIGKYRKGTHLEAKKAAEIIIYKQCKNLCIRPDTKMQLCVDGEISEKGEVKFEVIPKAIRIVIPEPEKKIILASASPRRKEILSAHGANFEVKVKEVDEYLPEGLDPELGVMILAMKKASVLGATAKNNEVIIAADTVVVKDEVMGKPKDENDAIRMLRKLRNTDHKVITGMAILDKKTGKKRIFFETTIVYFKNYSDEDIKAYIETGEYKDKAGAYAIQGIGSSLAEKIDGDLENVIGLPFERLRNELRQYFDLEI